MLARSQRRIHDCRDVIGLLWQDVDEPIALDGVGVAFAAFCRAAAGLVFNECSGGTGSADVGELRVWRGKTIIY